MNDVDILIWLTEKTIMDACAREYVDWKITKSQFPQLTNYMIRAVFEYQEEDLEEVLSDEMDLQTAKEIAALVKTKNLEKKYHNLKKAFLENTGMELTLFVDYGDYEIHKVGPNDFEPALIKDLSIETKNHWMVGIKHIKKICDMGIDPRIIVIGY